MIENAAGDRSLIAETLMQNNRNAMLALSGGNPHAALALFRESYRIEKELRMERESAQTLVNIANAELLLGQSEHALEAAEQAATIFESHGDRRGRTHARVLTGSIHAHLGHHDKAEAQLDEVLRHAESDDMRGEAHLVLHLMYRKLNDRAKAQEAVTRAIGFFERCERHDRLKMALASRAMFFESLGRSTLAVVDRNRIRTLEEQL